MSQLFPFSSTTTFGRSIDHPFFKRHMPRQSTRWTFFCASQFLCVVVFYKGFSLFISFPSWTTFTSLTFIIHIFFTILFAFVGIVVQPCKCSTWSPSSLSLGFSPPTNVCWPLDGIWVLGIPFQSISFFCSFLQDAPNEDVCLAKALSRLGDVQIVFGIIF